MQKLLRVFRNDPERIFSVIVVTRDATRPFIVAMVEDFGCNCMVLPRPVKASDLPVAGTKLKVKFTEIHPHRNLASAQWVA